MFGRKVQIMPIIIRNVKIYNTLAIRLGLGEG